jgi:hypothetical protein
MAAGMPRSGTVGGAVKPFVCLVCVVCLCGPSATGAVECAADVVSRGRETLRAMDCARCHGRDYDGWSGPSLRAAVREGTRERFERLVLDGDIVRGMPGYRSQPRVVENLDAIYAYLGCGATPSAAVASIPINPGVYHVTVETILPHLEENLRYATTRRNECLDALDATTLFPLLRHQAFTGCTLTGGHMLAGQVHYELICRNPQAATGGARITVEGDAMRAVLEVKMGGKNMTLSQRVEGHRVGACEVQR